MYCGRCGTQNDDNARFCSECGADLSPVNPAAVPVQPVQPRFAWNDRACILRHIYYRPYSIQEKERNWQRLGQSRNNHNLCAHVRLYHRYHPRAYSTRLLKNKRLSKGEFDN